MSSFQSTLRAEHDLRRHAAVDGYFRPLHFEDEVAVDLTYRRDLRARGESESRQEPAGLLLPRDPDDRTAFAYPGQGYRDAGSMFLLVAAFDAVIAITAADVGLLSTLTHEN